MSKINVGTRSKAGDAEALAAIKANLSANQKIVEEDGQTFVVEKSVSGVTLRTRIA